MKIGSYMFQSQKTLDEMINECIEVLKHEPSFDLTFLKGVKPFSNFYSQAQYQGVLRIYNRWNVELKYYQMKNKNEM